MRLKTPSGGSDEFFYRQGKKRQNKSSLVRKKKKRLTSISLFNAANLTKKQKEQLEDYYRRKGDTWR